MCSPPRLPGVKGKLSPVNSALGWLPVCANGGGKGSERGFLEGCILRVSLQLFTQLLAKSTTCFKDLCLCGAGSGSRSFEGENELMFSISPSPYGPIFCSQNKTPVQSGTLNKNVSTLFSSLALYS